MPTVGGSEDGVGATRVDNACCWMDMSREAAGVKVKSERVRKGGPTFEWKRLEGSRGTETRESEKRNVDGWKGVTVDRRTVAAAATTTARNGEDRESV